MYQHPNKFEPTSNALNNPTLLLERRNRALACRNPELAQKLSQMALPLAPLVRITTGQVHPAFPATLMNFWVLTSEQLDELAHFYHQMTPSEWSRHYPCPVVWGPELGLEEKRRKIGRFIGLKGCESPVKSEEEIMRSVREKVRRGEDDELVWRGKGRFY